MTHNEPTVAEVVAGLTKAQREAVVKCWGDGNEIVQGGQDDSDIATRVINSLRCKEMLAWVAPSDFYTKAIWRLNSLGLAVCEHLPSARSLPPMIARATLPLPPLLELYAPHGG